MATKTTGLEFKAFLSDGEYWDQSLAGGEVIEHWYEYADLTVNGETVSDDLEFSDLDLSDLNDDDVICILAGVVMSSVPGDAGQTLESFFKTWQKKQSSTLLSVRVPKGRLDAVKAAIRDAGGEVL